MLATSKRLIFLIGLRSAPIGSREEAVLLTRRLNATAIPDRHNQTPTRSLWDLEDNHWDLSLTTAKI